VTSLDTARLYPDSIAVSALDNATAVTTVSTILEASAGLAGILLVFVSFVYTRGEALATKRGDRFKNVARGGLFPLLVSLLTAWLCLNFLEGDQSAYFLAAVAFRTSLVMTAVYAAVVLFVYL
jgi:hypothetical protein